MEAINISNRVNSVAGAYNQNTINKTSPSEIEERKDKISEFTGLNTNVKAETNSIKSSNELFGALKKSEKTLVKMEKLIDTDQVQEAKELLSVTYKDEKILYNIPLKEGKFDGGTLIEKAFDNGDVKEAINSVKESLAKDLEAVKAEMLGKTSQMGNNAQSNIDNSGISLDLSSISKSSNMDYLKQQMKGLLE